MGATRAPAVAVVALMPTACRGPCSACSELAAEASRVVAALDTNSRILPSPCAAEISSGGSSSGACASRRVSASAATTANGAQWRGRISRGQLRRASGSVFCRSFWRASCTATQRFRAWPDDSRRAAILFCGCTIRYGGSRAHHHPSAHGAAATPLLQTAMNVQDMLYIVQHVLFEALRLCEYFTSTHCMPVDDATQTTKPCHTCYATDMA